MIRKVTAFLLCLLLIGGLCMTASAVSAYVIDQAGLLTSPELNVLAEETRELSRTYDMDVVYMTVDSLYGKSAMRYADDYYDQGGYAEDGILFLIAMEEREWYISTCGHAISALSDRELEQIEEEILPYLSAGRYADAFYHFQAILPGYLDNDEPERSVNLFLSLLIGAVTASIVILIMRGSMNTKARQHSAEDYLKQGSYHLRTQRDLFLYSNVSKVRRQQNSSGGSSVHRSSGGRSHGGRGGRF